MQATARFQGSAITSMLSLFADAATEPTPAQPTAFDPLTVMFTSVAAAMAWRDSLTNTQLTYLAAIDKFIANLEPGVTITIANIVKPENTVQFYRCLSYIIIGCNLFGALSFNTDFSKLKLNNLSTTPSLSFKERGQGVSS